MSHLTFPQALTQAEAQARSILPAELHERLSCAVALVKDGRVFQATDGTWEVASTSTAGVTYAVNGTCRCDDSYYNKPAYCKHRLAMFLSQRVLSLIAQPQTPVVPAAAHEPQDATSAPAATVGRRLPLCTRLRPCLRPQRR